MFPDFRESTFRGFRSTRGRIASNFSQGEGGSMMKKTVVRVTM